MLALTPEMVLGKSVIARDGACMGDVVDVGLHDMRRVKFLVVEDDPAANPHHLVRVNVEEVEAVSPTTVRVRSV